VPYLAAVFNWQRTYLRFRLHFLCKHYTQKKSPTQNLKHNQHICIHKRARARTHTHTHTHTKTHTHTHTYTNGEGHAVSLKPALPLTVYQSFAALIISPKGITVSGLLHLLFVMYSVGSDTTHQWNLRFHRNHILTLSALNCSTHMLISSASCCGLMFSVKYRQITTTLKQTKWKKFST